MKKSLGLFALLLLLIAFAAAPAAFAAGSDSAAVNAQVNPAKKQVTIAGKTEAGPDKQVTVVVLNPAGNVDYIDQTISGAGGRYSFIYTLDETASGTYSVSVGGDGFDTPVTTSLAYTVSPGDGNPPSTGNPGNSGNSGGNGHKQVVGEQDLQKGNDGSVAITLQPGTSELLLPLNSGDIVGSGALSIHSDSFSLTIDAAELQALAALAQSAGVQNAQISLQVEQPTAEEAQQLIKQANGGHVSVRAAGDIFVFHLSVVGDDGQAHSLDAFDKPVRLSLPFDADANPDLLGIYYYNEATAKWEYIGGSIDSSGSHIVAELPHFSTYAVLEYDKSFDDVPAAHWAYEAVTTLAAKHVVNGVTDSAFAPGRDVTRAEFAALLARALDLKAAGSVPFADVGASSAFAGEITAAYEAKLIQGRADGTFAPGDKITREEMAAMIVRAFEYASGRELSGDGASIADSGAVSAWAVNEVSAAVKSGLMQGVGGSRFAPAASATRAETAQAVLHLLQALQ